MSPSISVIIPVYNGERFITEALNSVLQQCHHGLEIIVVDNGSTDSTPDILQGYGDNLRYVCQPNSGGPASPRNHGLALARGDTLVFLDADDLWPANRLDVQLPVLDDPTVDIALGHTRRFQGDVFLEPELSMKLTAALIRRSVFDRVGGFDTTLRFCDDWDWFMRVREQGVSLQVHPEVTILYRRHDENLSLQEAAANREFMLVLKRSLDRRRKQGITTAESMLQLSQFTRPY